MVKSNKPKETGTVLFDRDIKSGIAYLTLNRPSKLNALSNCMLESLEKALFRVNDDNNVKVVVMRGQGDAFCSGADINEMIGGSKSGPHKLNEDQGIDVLRQSFKRSHNIISTIYRSEKPHIAAIQGVAIGAGFDIACACDIRLATRRAKFRSSYVNLGLVPGYGGIWLYQRLMGYGKSAKMILTGDWMEADEALDCGLVDSISNDNELEAESKKLAMMIAKGPPIAIRLSKMLMRDSVTMDLESSLRMAATAEAITLSSEDHKEGVAALREKRKPIFKGN